MRASFSKSRPYLLIYAALAALLLLTHAVFLHLPLYWDELGQFVPASLDLFRGGHIVPRTTLPNVHPPGLMAYLAACWTVTGYSIEATRCAMLLLAAVGALAVFLLAIELARGAPGTPAFAALAMLLISPLFFAQAMLAQLDMPAMCFTALALLLFLQNRFRWCAAVCVVLVLVKETGLVAPALFGVWLVRERRWRAALLFLAPLAVLLVWLAILKQATGHWFGNREFTDYNVFYPLNPARLLLALLRRAYYLFLSTGHAIGTVALCLAWRKLPLFRDRSWRIVTWFAGLHVLAVCALGGAVLERYLLPVLPLVYIAFAIGFASLGAVRHRLALAALLLCLAAANFVNPVYPFPLENNLAFARFVELELDAARDVSGRPGTVATVFPMSDALRRPEAGYVTSPREVIQLEGFRRRDLEPLQAKRPDCLIVFDTIWDPLHLFRIPAVTRLMTRFYGYEPPLTADEIAALIPMRVVRREKRGGLNAAVLVR